MGRLLLKVHQGKGDREEVWDIKYDATPEDLKKALNAQKYYNVNDEKCIVSWMWEFDESEVRNSGRGDIDIGYYVVDTSGKNRCVCIFEKSDDRSKGYGCKKDSACHVLSKGRISSRFLSRKHCIVGWTKVKSGGKNIYSFIRRFYSNDDRYKIWFDDESHTIYKNKYRWDRREGNHIYDIQITHG
jgi:hypothetical protein